MKWNWQQDDWPHFRWSEEALDEKESQFQHQSGIFIGATKHVNIKDKTLLTISIMTDEALKTSEIEGEFLNRDSVQASLRRHFGLEVDHRRIPPAEQGIAELMTDLYHHFDQPLTHETLYHWHKMLMRGRTDLKDIGHYRTHKEPMQIISGSIDKPKIHFKAPSSKIITREMNQFIKWFLKTASLGKKPLPALTRAGIVHLYFVSIHPFEDGNGRIGRVLALKSLSEFLNEPTLIALSEIIQKNKKSYYKALDLNTQHNEITDWLLYFAETILKAQKHSLNLVNFLIEKTKLYDRIKDQLNDRQEKILAYLFRVGYENLKKGLNAEKYIKITAASRATATRDLQDLVEKQVLLKVGQLKSTRYFLNIKTNSK